MFLSYWSNQARFRRGMLQPERVLQRISGKKRSPRPTPTNCAKAFNLGLQDGSPHGSDERMNQNGQTSRWRHLGRYINLGVSGSKKKILFSRTSLSNVPKYMLWALQRAIVGILIRSLRSSILVSK